MWFEKNNNNYDHYIGQIQLVKHNFVYTFKANFGLIRLAVVLANGVSSKAQHWNLEISLIVTTNENVYVCRVKFFWLYFKNIDYTFTKYQISNRIECLWFCPLWEALIQPLSLFWEEVRWWSSLISSKDMYCTSSSLIFMDNEIPWTCPLALTLEIKYN